MGQRSIAIGITLTPKRGRRGLQGGEIRQVHRKDRQALVAWADGTTSRLAFAAIVKDYNLAHRGGLGEEAGR